MKNKLKIKKIALLLVIILAIMSPIYYVGVKVVKADSIGINGIIYSYVKTSDTTCSIIKIDNKNNKSITIPQTINGYRVVSIGSLIEGTNIFGNTSEKTDNIIEHLFLPEGLIEIGRQAFAGLTNLAGVKFPQSLESLRYGCFSNSGLHKVSVEDNITTLEDNCFVNCANLREVYIGKGIDTLQRGVFDTEGIKKMYLNCKIIGKDAMYSTCSKFRTLEEVSFGSNVRIIQEDAFVNQHLLTTINFEEGIEEIKKNAFYQTHVNNVIIPSTMKILEENCFQEALDVVKILSKDVLIQQNDSNYLTLGYNSRSTYVYGYDNSSTELYCKQMKEKGFPINFISIDNVNNSHILYEYEHLLDKLRTSLQATTNEDIITKAEANAKLETLQYDLSLAETRISNLENELNIAINELEEAQKEANTSSNKAELEQLKLSQKEYEDKIEELNNKVNELNANLSSKDMTIANLVSVITTLSNNIGTVNTTTSKYEEQFNTIREELGITENENILVAIKSLKEKLASLEDENKNLSLDKEKLNLVLAQQKKDKDDLNSFLLELKNLVQEDTNDNTLEEIKQTLLRLEEQEAAIEEMEKNITNLEEKLNTANLKIEELQSLINNLEKINNDNKNEELQEKVDILTSELNQLTSENLSLGSQLSNQEIKLDSIKKENENLNLSISEIKTTLTLVNKENSNLTKENNELEAKNESLVLENQQIKERNKELEQAINELNIRKKQLEEQLEQNNKNVEEQEVESKDNDQNNAETVTN
ncbi:leucine-rich repeat protein [Anaerosporobacter faecicola]|uniref:leucine-rich repeat protein n=1 Tax=Anaerosporobacter faecicola TaxID=2718714 RepID=UPI0014396984|nr:leucine-rich repeat protein [Anaerosporobacter faecicola]